MGTKIKLGKVSNFDLKTGTGKVITEDEKYLLLDKDIEGNIEEGSLVLFRGEEIGDVKRAFFVKKYDEKSETDRQLIK